MRQRSTPRSILAAAIALLLAGCHSAPTLTASTVGPGATEAPAPSVTVSQVEPAPKVVLPTQDGIQAVPDEIIVHFDGEARKLPGATLKRTLALPNTYVYGIDKRAYSVQAAASWEDAEDIDYVEPNYLYTTTATPNDPLFSDYSWGVGADKAPQVWDEADGTGIKVAVVDTGVNANHADLKGQVLAGADMVNHDNDPTDDHGHGTHVAGTIAAIADNFVGVAGVAPHARIIPVKVLAANGSGSNDTIAEGILKAADLGAKIINMSLGGPDNSQTLEAAIKNVQARGVIVVCAAGNDNVDTPFYPAANDGVIGVAATDPANRKASFSNYGAYIDIAAPGTSIGSTGFQGNYVKMSGTSMASPHVAGAIAVLLSKYPALKLAQIQRLLQNTGHEASGFAMTAQPRTIDVAAALAAAPTMDFTPPSRVAGVVATPAAPGEVVLSWSASSDNHGVKGYRVFRNGSALGTVSGTSYTDSTLKEGQTASYTVTAFDEDGNESTASAAVTGRGGEASEVYQALGVASRGTKELTITWTTNEPVTSYLQWGTTAAFGSGTATESTPSTQHSVTLTNLRRFKNYYFRVVGTDAAGARHYSATKKARTKLWFLF
jgi:thermitase